MFDSLFVAAVPDRRLSAKDYETLSLATLGGLLEFYDFIIFVFFANTIGQLFFPPEIPEWLRQFQTFGIFAAGYLARPLGGVVMAHAGDLRGRKQMFTLSIFLMALPTLGIGLLPTYGLANNIPLHAAGIDCRDCRSCPLRNDCDVPSGKQIFGNLIFLQSSIRHLRRTHPHICGVAA